MALDDSEKRDLEEQEKNQGFEDAFAQAEAGGDRAELTPDDDPANDQAEAEAAKAVTEEAERVAVEAQGEADRLAEEQKAAKVDPEKKPETEETYEQRWKSLDGIVKKKDEALKTAQETWETEKAALLAQVEETKKPPKKEDKPEATKDDLTPEEKDALAEYEADFDVVSKMEGKKRDKELTKLRKEFQEKMDEITSQLAPIKGVTEFVATSQKEKEIQSEEAHFKAIEDTHPGWEQYRDDGSVLKWIESKSKYLQKAFLETYQKGTAEDIVNLLSDFKTDNNIQPSQTPDNVVSLNARKEEKRKALAAVDTSRRAVNPNMKVAEDYAGAFEEALHKSGG